jgi:hypothetical protein
MDAKFQAFFEAIPVHQAICLARERDVWPPPDIACVVALPAWNAFETFRA